MQKKKVGRQLQINDFRPPAPKVTPPPPLSEATATDGGKRKKIIKYLLPPFFRSGKESTWRVFFFVRAIPSLQMDG